MIVPSTLERTKLAFTHAVDRIFAIRAASNLRVKSLRTVEAVTSMAEPINIQIDDALALVLNSDDVLDEKFAALLEQRRLEGDALPLDWRYQFKRIIGMLSASRLRDASPDERQALASILAYARAALSYTNSRPNGLAAGIASLRDVDRLAGSNGEFAADIETWEDWNQKQRRLVRLRKQMKRIQSEIGRLAA